MRKLGLLLFAFVALATPAVAQPRAITIPANPVPIIDAELDGKPARLEVHLRLSASLLLNQAAADRLGIRNAASGRRVIGYDGGAELRGTPIRPRIVIGGRRAGVVMAAAFTAPLTERADGIIGSPALPYDMVTIVLGPEQAGMREIVLPLATDQRWIARAEVGGRSMYVDFDVSHPRSIVNRAASRLFDGEGAIVSDGPQTREAVMQGLAVLVQPVRTELRAFGLPIAPAVARTGDPLLGEAGADQVIVDARHPPPPMVSLGREALSRCATITMDRRARTLTLRCAA